MGLNEGITAYKHPAFTKENEEDITINVLMRQHPVNSCANAVLVCCVALAMSSGGLVSDGTPPFIVGAREPNNRGDRLQNGQALLTALWLQLQLIEKCEILTKLLNGLQA